MRIFKIVLTGGPCAGKSSTIEQLKKYLTEKYACNLYVVGESATELGNIGIHPTDFEKPEDFQKIILETQLTKERNINCALSDGLSNSLDSIILYDRGTIDNKAYFNTQQEFDELLKKYGLNEIDLLNEYDLVINLINTANSEFGLYETDSNSVRYENEDFAKVLDKSTLNAWLGHKNLKIVECTEDINDKYKTVFQYVDDLINNNLKEEYVSFEVDTEKSNITKYNDNNSKRIDIEEYYLDIDNLNNYKYIITKRTYKGESRFNISYECDINNCKLKQFDNNISEKNVQKLIERYGINKQINKSRLSFIDKFRKFDLDFYEDKVVLNSNLNMPNSKFELPEDIVIKDKSKVKTLLNK